MNLFFTKLNEIFLDKINKKIRLIENENNGK